MPKKPVLHPLSLAICTALIGTYSIQSIADETFEQLESLTIVGKRDERISAGATKLPMDIKETPQSISVIDEESMEDFATTDSNSALLLNSGILVDQYETNRSRLIARGYAIQMTQIDGLGMSNDWGTIQGQLDTYTLEKIELIRGANGLLTGVGNASGTVNYVRKRPTNQDEGEINLSAGSYSNKRLATDYNKVFTDDGSWAGRLVFTYEDKDSYIRDLNNERTSFYAVVDGQIGDHGTLTSGFSYQNHNQDSPMWGSLILKYADGSGQADLDQSTSTSQDWTYWDKQTENFFIEYLHELGDDWEAKLTYNYNKTKSQNRLFYAYGNLQSDNTGLVGWPYSSTSDNTMHQLDLNVSGEVEAFDRYHEIIVGASISDRDTASSTYAFDSSYSGIPLPALPYGGNVYPEPNWNSLAPNREGNQKLSRIYAASRVQLTYELKLIAGVNAIRLERSGSSMYGNASSTTSYPDTKEVSPYLGLTYDITEDMLGYVSYSDIFQNQDQVDYYGRYLDPMKGVNVELGLKTEWLDQNLLSTVAVFQAKQEGKATLSGELGLDGTEYYKPIDVTSRGIEFETVGKINDRTQVAVGFTHLQFSGDEGKNTEAWIPRNTVNARFSSRLSSMPELKYGISGRWYSNAKGDNADQDAYFVLDAFTSYDLDADTSIRLNINNLLNEKYIQGLGSGAIYGAPRNGLVTLTYNF